MVLSSALCSLLISGLVGAEILETGSPAKLVSLVFSTLYFDRYLLILPMSAVFTKK